MKENVCCMGFPCSNHGGLWFPFSLMNTQTSLFHCAGRFSISLPLNDARLLVVCCFFFFCSVSTFIYNYNKWSFELNEIFKPEADTIVHKAEQPTTSVILGRQTMGTLPSLYLLVVFSCCFSFILENWIFHKCPTYECNMYAVCTTTVSFGRTWIIRITYIVFYTLYMIHAYEGKEKKSIWMWTLAIFGIAKFHDLGVSCVVRFKFCRDANSMLIFWMFYFICQYNV